MIGLSDKSNLFSLDINYINKYKIMRSVFAASLLCVCITADMFSDLEDKLDSAGSAENAIAKEQIKRFDKNGDKLLSRDGTYKKEGQDFIKEMMKLWIPQGKILSCQQFTSKFYTKNFNVFDTNSDKKISVSEMENYVRNASSWKAFKSPRLK